MGSKNNSRSEQASSVPEDEKAKKVKVDEQTKGESRDL
jgi:hypothetical protein